MCCFLRSCTPTGEAILIINYVCARNYIYKQSITVYNSLICKNSRWIRRFKLIIFNIATQSSGDCFQYKLTGIRIMLMWSISSLMLLLTARSFEYFFSKIKTLVKS